MGNHRPFPTKCWIKYLEHLGLTRKRIKGSHYQWKKRGIRTIPVWESVKQVPADHIRASLRTLDKSMDEFIEWTKENC